MTSDREPRSRLLYAFLPILLIAVSLELFDMIQENSDLSESSPRPHEKNAFADPMFNRNVSLHRWGGENSTGIDISIVLKYLEWVNIFSQVNPLNPGWNKKTWRNYPNVPYVFGGQMDASSGCGDNRTVHVWASEAAIVRMGGFLAADMRPQRVVPMHRLLSSALDLLLDENDPFPSSTSKLVRLREAVDGGIPFLLNYEDYRRCSYRNWKLGENETYSLPIFSICGAARIEECNHQFPLPTYFTVNLVKNSSVEWDADFRQNDTAYPWANKTSKAVWRGAPTGLGGNKRFRNRFVATAHLKYTDIIDAELTAPETYIPFWDFQKYKAVLDMDGVSWSGRWGKIMCLNSVIIKIQPKFVDYFDEGLRPGVHYLHVHENLTNLEEVVRFALAEENSEKIRDMIHNARQWCRNQNVWQQLLYDVLTIFAEYVALLDRFDPKWQDKWSMSYLKPQFDMRPACR